MIPYTNLFQKALKKNLITLSNQHQSQTKIRLQYKSFKTTQKTNLLFRSSQKRSFCQGDLEKAEDQKHFQKFHTSLKYKFKIGSVKLPHYNKRKTGGEDALTFHDGMICVADGVGGWNEIGVDPSKYSNEICENVKREYLLYGHKYNYNPKTIFVEAAKKTESQGSSTFCMCTLDFEKQYLHTVNMGDSGYMVLRDVAPKSRPEGIFEKILKENGEEETVELKVLFKSEEQQHQFNFPYQVGSNGDSPEDCDTRVHEFRENDIIVLGSDGLWDNLFEDQILALVKPFYEANYKIKDLNLVANLLAEFAEKLSLSPKYKSPFSVKSRGLYLGGKSDDITIIVAQIVPNKI
jgi:protein phosphatase PTC7